MEKKLVNIVMGVAFVALVVVGAIFFNEVKSVADNFVNQLPK